MNNGKLKLPEGVSSVPSLALFGEIDGIKESVVWTLANNQKVCERENCPWHHNCRSAHLEEGKIVQPMVFDFSFLSGSPSNKSRIVHLEHSLAEKKERLVSLETRREELLIEKGNLLKSSSYTRPGHEIDRDRGSSKKSISRLKNEISDCGFLKIFLKVGLSFVLTRHLLSRSNRVLMILILRLFVDEEQMRLIRQTRAVHNGLVAYFQRVRTSIEQDSCCPCHAE